MSFFDLRFLLTPPEHISSLSVSVGFVLLNF